jgi:hypothetical protein
LGQAAHPNQLADDVNFECVAGHVGRQWWQIDGAIHFEGAALV